MDSITVSEAPATKKRSRRRLVAAIAGALVLSCLACVVLGALLPDSGTNAPQAAVAETASSQSAGAAAPTATRQASATPAPSPTTSQIAAALRYADDIAAEAKDRNVALKALLGHVETAPLPDVPSWRSTRKARTDGVRVVCEEITEVSAPPGLEDVQALYAEGARDVMRAMDFYDCAADLLHDAYYGGLALEGRRANIDAAQAALDAGNELLLAAGKTWDRADETFKAKAARLCE